MMRSEDIRQSDLYQYYAEFGKEVTHFSSNINYQNGFSQDDWQLISRKGFWKLPISRKLGGIGLGWSEFIVAIKGLVSTYSNIQFIAHLITHLSGIYIVLKYESDANKYEHLSILMNGEIPFLENLDDMNKFLSSPSSKAQEIYYDLMSFKRVLYGILAVEFIKDFEEDNNEILKLSQQLNLNNNYLGKDKLKKVEESLLKELFTITSNL